MYCCLQRGWLWGSIAFAWRWGRNEPIIGERVSHFALTAQGILTKCVRGVTFRRGRESTSDAIGDGPPQPTKT
jgi:hypothetical protein